MTEKRINHSDPINIQNYVDVSRYIYHYDTYIGGYFCMEKHFGTHKIV